MHSTTAGSARATQRVRGTVNRIVAAMVVSAAIAALAFAYCPVPWSAALLALAVLLMASAAAITQAREFFELANAATDDPRRTRIDLLQVANYIARQARENSTLRDLVADVSQFLGRQAISGKDLEVAAEKGWPVIEAVPGPVSYYHAGLRLVAHAALRHPSLINNFEARMRDVEGLSASVRRNIQAMDAEWASAMTLVAADMAAESGEFRSRLIAAAKDVQQLITSDELPTWDDFAEGPAGSAWPPLTLGVYPVLGGRWKETEENWSEGGGAGVAVTVFACMAGFGAMGDLLKMLACVLGVVAIIVAAILLV
jgi:hypothetical protein